MEETNIILPDQIKCTCTQCDLKKLFFGNVGNLEMQLICDQKIFRKYSKSQIIIHEGDEIQEFTYLKSGLVKLYRTSGDKEQIIHIAKPFDFVSILTIFSNSKYQYSVSALEDTVTCNLKMDDIHKMILKNGTFASDLMRRMSEVSDRIILEMLEVRKRNLKGRVAFILLYFADEIFNSMSFDLPVSRKEIAEWISMSTENVIRSLSEFRQDKVIKIFGKSIEIVNREDLEMISRLG